MDNFGFIPWKGTSYSIEKEVIFLGKGDITL